MKIGIIETGEVDEMLLKVHGSYSQMFKNLFKRKFISRHSLSSIL